MRTLEQAGHGHTEFHDAKAAVAHLQELYDDAVEFLSQQFRHAMEHGAPEGRVRAYYPEIRFTTSTYAQVATRLSFGHVADPGTYATTVTRPRLMRD